MIRVSFLPWRGVKGRMLQLESAETLTPVDAVSDLAAVNSVVRQQSEIWVGLFALLARQGRTRSGTAMRRMAARRKARSRAGGRSKPVLRNPGFHAGAESWNPLRSSKRLS